ncbi:hypothetical protein Tco_0172731, partial [Tanacetum coccineum]
NMANENVPAPAPIRFDEHILPFAAWVPIGKSNFLDEHRFTLDANLLREALEITPIDQAHQFVSPPLGDEIIDFVNELGYTEEIHFVSRMAVNNLYQPWRAILSMINHCLTGKTSSPTKKGRKDKPHVIPYCQFTKLIICHLGRKHNLHQRFGSLLHLAKEDLRLGNLKFVPKGEDDEVFGMPIPNELITNKIRNAPYYNTYMEMIAKHDQKLPPKRRKDKPATAKQLKPKLLREVKQTRPAPKPSIGSSTCFVWAIREPVAEATRPLLVVEGKGKAIATEEQAAQSLLALHTPKKKIRDSPSPTDAETGADTEKTNNRGDTEILQIGEELGEDVDNQVNLEEKTVKLDQGQAGSDPGKTPESRPPPEQVFMDEDQAGPDPGESRVALAGPNPEPTHDDFMANVYLTEKLNVEAEVVSMVIVSIHQASSSVHPLSTLVIDITPPKHESPPIQEPIFTATTTTIAITLPLPPFPQQQSTTNLELDARVTTLENKFSDLEQKSKALDNSTQNLGSRVFTLELRDLPHKINQIPDMKEILHQWMFESGTYKSLPKRVALYEAHPHPPPPDSDLSKKKRHDSGTSGSKQPPAPQSSAWKTSDTREAPSSSSKQKFVPHSEQPVKDVPISDDMNISDSEDTDTAHLPKIKTIPDWLKPIPEEDRPTSPEPDWFQMEECHLLLTNKVDLVNPEGHRVMPDVSKPLPLEGPPDQVTIQTQYFFNKDLEYLVLGDKGRRSALSISKLKAAQYLDFRLEELVPSLWIESEREYDISAAYGISYWWFKRKEFYITRHSALSDRSTVRFHMQILSVASLTTYERYVYTFLKEIVLRRADYKEYKISEADFKNLHPNDFKDLNIVIRKRVEDLQLGIESYQTKLNLTQPDWDASDFLFKEDCTIVSKPRAVIYKDRNDQKKMMRDTEVHKFSDDTLNRILDKLDHMVKDFKLFKFNPGIETRIWSEDDRRRSKEFIENIQVIPKYHGEDRNPARANIKQALGSFLDQEWYEHVGPQDTRPQDDERSQDDDQRFDLADDLKNAQDHISSTNTSHKTKSTTSKYKISHEESKSTS